MPKKTPTTTPAAPISGQVFIGFKCDSELARLIEKTRKPADRSLWIRQAVAEALRARGHVVPDAWIYPPDRSHRFD